MAFYLCRELKTGILLDVVADDLGIPRDLAQETSRELMERAFVLVLSQEGEVLVDDLEIVMESGILRYEISP